MIIAAAMSEIANQAGKEPWPPLASASWWFDKSSIALALSLFVGFICTVVIIWMGIVKEHHWDLAREKAAGEIARLNNETERLRADNLALQELMQPRRLPPLIEISSPDKPVPPETALEMAFKGIRQFAGTSVLIQVVPDMEAKTLANDMLLVLPSFRWHARIVDESESKFSSMLISPGVDVSWTSGDDLNEAAQALADAFANAKLTGPTSFVDVHGRPRMIAQGLPITLPRRLGPQLDPSIHAVLVFVGMKPMNPR